MKLITYELRGQTAVGALRNERDVVPLTAAVPDMLALIAGGAQGIAQAQALVEQAGDVISLDDVRLLAPIPDPLRNIICLGKNYADHADESNRAWGDKLDLPEYPIVFNKATTTINGPFDDIPYDAAVSTDIDFEAELVVVIGRAGRHIKRDEALDYVFGYTVMNDVSARDLQRRHNQFFLGKSLDGHGPMGPWIVTAAEIADPQNLSVTCHVNGVQKQNGSTSQMIFDIRETIVQLSLGMTLLPGDLIATGTPSGVGFARTPPEFLKPGDVVACTVENIGTIRNTIVQVA